MLHFALIWVLKKDFCK